MTTQPCVILGAAKNLSCHKLLEPMPAHKNEQFVSEIPEKATPETALQDAGYFLPSSLNFACSNLRKNTASLILLQFTILMLMAYALLLIH